MRKNKIKNLFFSIVFVDEKLRKSIKNYIKNGGAFHERFM